VGGGRVDVRLNYNDYCMCLIAYIMFSVVLKKALYVNVLLRAICIEQIGRERVKISRYETFACIHFGTLVLQLYV
jgi:hypothetical protein